MFHKEDLREDLLFFSLLSTFELPTHILQSSWELNALLMGTFQMIAEGGKG